MGRCLVPKGTSRFTYQAITYPHDTITVPGGKRQQSSNKKVHNVAMEKQKAHAEMTTADEEVTRAIAKAEQDREMMHFTHVKGTIDCP